MAVGVGFEPTVRRQAYNGFRDRRFQPLSHPTMMIIFLVGVAGFEPAES